MGEATNDYKNFRLPEICIKKYDRNTRKEKELIDSVSKGNINNMYNILWNEPVSVKVKRDFYGSDLLTVATQKDQNDLVKLLMKMDLEPNTRNSYGVTPAHWAANNGNEYLIKVLCDHGLTLRDLEKKDEFGSTPLHFAALKNNESIVHLLISIGINPTVINNDGKRASDVTTDITIKKFLKEEEIRYMAEHYKKKGKKKGKKKSKSKSSTPNRKKNASVESASSRKSISKQSSMVKSTSQLKKSSTTSTKRLSSSSKKHKETSKRILPPTIYNKKSIVSTTQEKSAINPTSYAMKNFNQDILTLPDSNKSLNQKDSPYGSNSVVN